jgi:hypothetical protein
MLCWDFRTKLIVIGNQMQRFESLKMILHMIKAYNFLGSWQLFPEKGNYTKGARPKSGTYRIEADKEKNELSIRHNWVTLENQAFHAEYSVQADGQFHPIQENDWMDSASVTFIDSIQFEITLRKEEEIKLKVIHEILPNGHLRIRQEGVGPNGEPFSDQEIFHRQMSVLPYAASVSGAVIKPTEEGVIRHKSLTAMEEQTNMQLDQIRKQIELLALQAQEIQKRKELSHIIYNAKLSFQPVIGQVYFLYEKQDDTVFISMIAPHEWGRSAPFKRFIAKVKLLADHTWTELA